MKDFNSYANGKKSGTPSGSPHGNSSPTEGLDIGEVLSFLSGKYEGASEEEIISAIIKEAEKGRANGTLTDAQILEFERTVSPMLNSQQRKKLNRVIRFLLKK